MSKRTTRVASLDFLRSFAIVLVLLAHTVLAYGAPRNLAFLQLGGTGVDLFFVLSGWLLGRHLFKELSETGSIDVKRFWCRRWLRTLPAYYAVLALTLLQFSLTRPEASLPLQYLCFGQNYAEMPVFHVSWSLCVEEHFYLLVAPAILLVTRFRKLLLPVLGIAVIGPGLCRMLGLFESMEQTHIRFDACAGGVLLAAASCYLPDLWKQLEQNATTIGAVAMSVYLILYAAYFSTGVQIATDPAIFTVISMAFVLFAVSSETVKTRLTFRGCHYIASRSYAIYLLHPEVLAIMKRFAGWLPFPIYLLIAFCGSCMVAEVLYRCVERPVMEAREYFKVTRSEVLSQVNTVV